ncbi:MAG TPA: winged helix DNA-binding domain-containing protein [Thermomicrobiales bacterium]|jgi:hypothetical protein|nr:winged helix DNA-binding domain-containing protein [Thermomicrobiales bacterium]
MSQPELLSHRQLNRALLARQFLLERVDMSSAAMIAHLVGMQAQVPDAPYIGLWSRLRAYQADDMATRVAARDHVRLTTMRGTIHLVSAKDALVIRPLIAPVITRAGAIARFRSLLGDRDLGAFFADATAVLMTEPMGRTAAGRALASRWPGIDEDALGHAATALLPTIQAPPRGVWRSRGPVAWEPIEQALGQPTIPPIPLPDLVRRYLAAFGPASMADFGKWSGLTTLREAFEGLRPDLVTYRGPDGRELFDIPGGPIPDPATPAPPRFLPEYDNVILSHADRSRIMYQRELPALPAGFGGATGTLLVDGMLAATWRITTTRTSAALAVTPFQPIDATHHDAITAEGEGLLGFIHPALPDRSVVFNEPREQRDPRVRRDAR